MNKTLFGKILLMSLIVILVVSGVTAIMMDLLVERYVFHSKEVEMTKLGQRVAQNVITWFERSQSMMGGMGSHGNMGMGMMRGMWMNRVTEMIRDLEVVLDARIWLIDPEGQIYIQGHQGAHQLTSREIAQLRAGQALTFSDWSDEGNQAILAVATPIRQGDIFHGGLFIITPMHELHQIQTQLRRILLISALLGGIVAVILVFFFSRRLVYPIREMQRLIQQIRRGDFSGQIQIQRDDELGQLAEHFNEMSNELDETIQLLQNEQEQTQRIINSMDEGVISLNKGGEVVVLNPTAEKILGVHLAWAPDQVFLNLPEIQEQIQLVEEEKTPKAREIVREGQVLLAIASPIIVDDEFMGIVVVLQDITQRWRLIQMQKDLIANVSHEFKTPLTSIQGFVELLLDQKITDARAMDSSLKIIYSETLRLIRMVNDLLGMAKMDSAQLDKKCYGVKDLIVEVTDSLSFKLQEAEVTVKIDSALEQVSLMVDKDRMEQVFYNLLDNAIRFSPQGGQIQVRGVQKDYQMEIQIHDQGPGVPESEQELIFDRFYKVEKARSTNTSGTGLGLAIVRSIVEEHGGQISVQNHPEGGAVFKVRLPLER